MGNLILALPLSTCRLSTSADLSPSVFPLCPRWKQTLKIRAGYFGMGGRLIPCPSRRSPSASFPPPSMQCLNSYAEHLPEEGGASVSLEYTGHYSYSHT